MSNVFVGGSRRISRLNVEVQKRLEQIIDKQLAVLVGDANGADKAVQDFFRSRHYPNVVVFCTEGKSKGTGYFSLPSYLVISSIGLPRGRRVL